MAQLGSAPSCHPKGFCLKPVACERVGDAGLGVARSRQGSQGHLGMGFFGDNQSENVVESDRAFEHQIGPLCLLDPSPLPCSVHSADFVISGARSHLQKRTTGNRLNRGSFTVGKQEKHTL